MLFEWFWAFWGLKMHSKSTLCRRNPKGWFPKGWFSRNENRNEGTFGCSPERKTGTRVRSGVPPERKPERGHIRQNHPFTKPPFFLPVTLGYSEPGAGLLGTPDIAAGIAPETPIAPMFFRYRRVSRYTPSPPNRPYRSRGEGVARGIAAQAALWGVLRYTRVSLR